MDEGGGRGQSAAAAHGSLLATYLLPVLGRVHGSLCTLSGG